MKLAKNKGFTLVELLVVIGIVVLIAAIAIPSSADFLQQRRLKSVAQIVKMSCIEARSSAIAEREDQYLVFFVNHGGTFNENFTIPDSTLTNTQQKGAPNTLYRFDSNKNNAENNSQVVLLESYELPELLIFQEPKQNFAFRFKANGSLEITGFSDKSNDPSQSDDTDIVIRDVNENETARCFLDVIRNTGQIDFSVREKN